MLFGNMDWIPVIMPEQVTIMTKSQKKGSPKKKREKDKKIKDKDTKSDSESDGDEVNVDPPLKSHQTPVAKKGMGLKKTSNLFLQAIDK